MLECSCTYRVVFKVHKGWRTLCQRMLKNFKTFLKSLEGIYFHSCQFPIVIRKNLSMHNEIMEFFPFIDFNCSSVIVSSFLDENWRKNWISGKWDIIKYSWCLKKKLTKKSQFSYQNHSTKFMFMLPLCEIHS